MVLGMFRLPPQQQPQQPSSSLSSSTTWKLSRWYCWLSAVGAALAIVTAPPHDSSSISILAAQPHNKSGEPMVVPDVNNNNNVCWWDPLSLFDSCKSPPLSSSTESHAHYHHRSSLSAEQQKNYNNNNKNYNNNNSNNNNNNNNNGLVGWLRWILPPHHSKEQQSQQQQHSSHQQQKSKQQHRIQLFSGWPHQQHHQNRPWRLRILVVVLAQWMDPQLWNPFPPTGETVTGLIDKVLTSTWRLLLITNWLLALTVLLHTAVADWFLGDWYSNSNSNSNNPHTPQQQTRTPNLPDPWTGTNNSTTPSTSRERMGGFLVFKLLLISAVVAPDTVDLMILLSWYTLLSFLRSLVALAAQQQQQQQQHQWTNHSHISPNNNNNNNSTAESASSSRPPSPGVWKLLAFCLLLDTLAAAVCVGLFHGAGTGMVLLLTGDCALLAVDCTTHLIQHVQYYYEYQQVVQQWQALEEEEQQQQQEHQEQQEQEEVKEEEQDEQESRGSRVAASNQATAQDRLSRDLDRRMEVLEQQHLVRSAWLESAIFVLQLLSDVLMIAHFLHIWSLHGVQLSLIDGVLALHLHSSIQAASQKIMERRHMYKIARDMEGAFADASPLELRKAAAAGDVCCICLGTMSSSYCWHNAHDEGSASTTADATTSSGPSSSSPSSSSASTPLLLGSGFKCNVKKVACGHLYHANCLREVIERARSMEAARCPLCRASIVHGNNSNNNITTVRTADNVAPQAATAPAAAVVGERALFRFTTEHLFPAWLPLPALSFEVVRRSAQLMPAAPAQNNNDDNNNNIAVENNNNDNNNNNAAQQQQTRLRRLLLLAGMVRMTAEEDQVALEHLMEMFPQYDREDLRAALRQRGSPEAVAESVLLGTWTPPGGARIRR